MILYNISFIMAHHIINKSQRERVRKKYSYAINKKWRYIIVAILSSIIKEKAVTRLILKTLISQDILPIRQNRKCKRLMKSQTLVCFNYRFS